MTLGTTSSDVEEYSQAKEEYMACLKEQGSQAKSCRALAKLYLECRMER